MSRLYPVIGHTCSRLYPLVSHPRPCGDGAPQTTHDIWEIWAAGASNAGGSSSPGHSAAAVQRGYWGPPIHNMGLCSRPGEDHNAWKLFGPEPTRAIEPQHRLPVQRWILGGGLRGGGPGRPPFWRTLKESSTGLGLVTLKINTQHTGTGPPPRLPLPTHSFIIGPAGINAHTTRRLGAPPSPLLRSP